MITEYTIVVTHSWVYTQRHVNAKIAEGWEPLGGLSVTPCTRLFRAGKQYAQAMVRREGGSGAARTAADGEEG